MKKSLFWIYVLSSAVYFCQGTEAIPTLPFFFYLKENLHLNESRIMFLTSWITLAWLIKPLWGYLIDSSKFSKKTWILASLIGSLFFALLLGLLHYLPLIWLIICMAVTNINTAIRDVGVDGIMCVEGKKAKITGRIQSLQWGFLTIATIITGFLGGYLAEHYNYQMGYLILIPIYISIIAIVMNHKPSKVTKSNINLRQTLKQLFTDTHLLLVGLFIFLFNFSPSFGTPLIFILQDKFHWSKQFIGTMDAISAGMGLIGAGLYFYYSKKLNLHKWLLTSVFISALITLCYLFYTPITAIVYKISMTIVNMFIFLLIMDFMAKNTKAGLEATSFALLCSISNLAVTCNGFTGSFLFPILGLQGLIIISAMTSFLCLPLIPYLKLKE
jgi:MFS family permease